MPRSSTLALALLLGAALAAAALPAHAQSSSSGSVDGEEPEETEAADPYDFTQEDGPGLRIYGKSGKMLLGRGLDPKDDPNRLEVDFYKMTEIDVVRAAPVAHRLSGLRLLTAACTAGR